MVKRNKFTSYKCEACQESKITGLDDLSSMNWYCVDSVVLNDKGI